MIANAAELLAELRLRRNGRDTPLDDLPENCRPRNLQQAYQIQARLREHLAAHGWQTTGWKIGCTTQVMQQYLNINHPCAGTLYQTTLHRERAELQAADYFQLGLECELAVRLATDLPGVAGGYNKDRVARAVAAVMASVEIVEHRFVDFSKAATASLVADDFFSAGCVLGAERDPTALDDLASLSGGFIQNGAAGERGTGSAILGHPLNALAWLADHAVANDTPLAAGDIVTLGSVVKTIYPAAGDQVTARFDGLAPVSLQID